MSVDFVLHEAGVGYALFKVTMQPDAIGAQLAEVQKSSADLSRFGKMVQLVSWVHFTRTEQYLENINDISEGMVSDLLRAFLEANLPKPSKSKSKVTLAVIDKALAGAIKAAFPGVECETWETSKVAAELFRGIRLHATKLLRRVQDDDDSRQLQEGDLERAQRYAGAAYSRAKVKFAANKNDQHIINSINALDNLDKTVNTFAMRVREWYGQHFPELYSLVSDNHTYAKLALYIGDKKSLSDDSLHELAAFVNDDKEIATNIIGFAKTSMGADLSEEDMKNIREFAGRVDRLTTYRKELSAYLVSKMGVVAPNLAVLLGENVAARLIAKASSLTNLAKAPASTLQILGAEKALFRALKTKSNTPKYGLIYHSSFIGRAGARNKGRISRFLANKCSIASRIDNFSENPSTTFGEALRKQVEERLDFYSSGSTPRKNADVMAETMSAVRAAFEDADGDLAAKAPTKGGKVVLPPVTEDMQDIIPGGEEANVLAEGEDKQAEKQAKKERKLLKAEKKRKRDVDDIDDLDEDGQHINGVSAISQLAAADDSDDSEVMTKADKKAAKKAAKKEKKKAKKEKKEKKDKSDKKKRKHDDSDSRSDSDAGKKDKKKKKKHKHKHGKD